MSTLRSAIAHNASNGDVFPSRVARTRQAEFLQQHRRFAQLHIFDGLSQGLTLSSFDSYLEPLFRVRIGNRPN